MAVNLLPALSVKLMDGSYTSACLTKAPVRSRNNVRHRPSNPFTAYHVTYADTRGSV